MLLKMQGKTEEIRFILSINQWMENPGNIFEGEENVARCSSCFMTFLSYKHSNINNNPSWLIFDKEWKKNSNWFREKAFKLDV